MVIKNYKIALKDKSINLSIFYLLLLNVNMFIVLSGFGQTRLFGLGLSFIFSLMSLFLFLININKIPTRILSSYLMLLLYTLSIVIIGHDFYHWSISLFTLTAICLFSFVRLEEKDYLLMLFISSIFSLIVLISYTIFGFLSNWNPNSIGMFTTFGLLGFLIILHGSESNKYRLVSMIFIILSVYFIYLTESRNNVLIYIIALLSIIIHKILLNPLIYSSIALN